METCENCSSTIKKGERWELHGKILCEDCYICERMPKMPKSHYNNDAEFMQRLKDSNTVRNQQFH